jgi:hypothetical protein
MRDKIPKIPWDVSVTARESYSEDVEVYGRWDRNISTTKCQDIWNSPDFYLLNNAAEDKYFGLDRKQKSYLKLRKRTAQLAMQ